MIETPYASEWLPERQLTKLYFHHQPAVLAYVRGAIAWPLPEGEGVALIAGQIIPSGLIVVWETYPFNAIMPIFKGNEQVYRGLSDFLGRCWTLYRCRMFFWAQDPIDAVKYYIRLIFESETIQPYPQLVQIPRFSPESADALFSETVARKGAMIDKNNQLLRSHLAMKDEPERARGYHALRVLLNGFARTPYRE